MARLWDEFEKHYVLSLESNKIFLRYLRAKCYKLEQRLSLSVIKNSVEVVAMCPRFRTEDILS